MSDMDIIKALGKISKSNRRLESSMAGLQRRSEPAFAWSKILSLYSILPGLRGFWSMANMDYQGNILDLSGNTKTLTYTGNPKLGYSGFRPEITFDGSGDYLVRSDEASLDITGTESFMTVASQGVSFGGWFNLPSLPTIRSPLISKWSFSGGNQRSFQTIVNPSGYVRFNLSSDGSSVAYIDSTLDVITDAWYFIVGTFSPGSIMTVFVNESITSLESGVPAAIFQGTSDLTIATDDDKSICTAGKSSLCFLCAAYLEDAIVQTLYQQTKVLFH